MQKKTISGIFFLNLILGIALLLGCILMWKLHTTTIPVDNGFLDKRVLKYEGVSGRNALSSDLLELYRTSNTLVDAIWIIRIGTTIGGVLLLLNSYFFWKLKKTMPASE